MDAPIVEQSERMRDLSAAAEGMQQNGRLNADDASGLIQQLDALHTYEQQTS